MHKVLESQNYTPQVEKSNGAGRRSRSKIGKGSAKESRERGVEMAGAFCSPSLEFFAVRDGHPAQRKEMLAFSHFRGLDAPTSKPGRPPAPAPASCAK